MAKVPSEVRTKTHLNTPYTRQSLEREHPFTRKGTVLRAGKCRRRSGFISGIVFTRIPIT